MAESVQDQGVRAGVDVMAVEGDEAAETEGARRRKKAQTEVRGEHVASKEQSAGTVSPAEEAAGKLGGARRAVKKKNGKCPGTVSTTEEAAGQLGGARTAVRKKKSARPPEARTEFRTVNGKYGAQIRHSEIGRWLGTFDAAEEAARAYDDAAVELHGASAVTNFKASGELSGQAAGSAKMKVKKPAPARPDSQTGFRGVQKLPSGKYSAKIWDSKRKSEVYLGRFGSAEEAARAYDAAAIKRRGVAARTNFEQQPSAVAADDGEVSSNAAARTIFEQQPTAVAADDGEVSSMDLPNDFPELPALDFSESLIPGPQMDDLRTDLPPAQSQLVQEFLKDFDEVVA